MATLKIFIGLHKFEMIKLKKIKMVKQIMYIP